MMASDQLIMKDNEYLGIFMSEAVASYEDALRGWNWREQFRGAILECTGIC